MTPKEKAEELVYLFKIDLHDNLPPLQSKMFKLCILKSAKQCALKTVNEMINCLNDDDLYIQGESNIDGFINFYKEVKQEIENL